MGWTSSSVVEGEDTASYTVTLSEAIPSVEEGGSDVVVTLSYSYTTASGDDITETADVTIAAGSASGTFTISTIDDALAEGAENFQVSITNGGIADSNFENVEVSSTSNSVTTTIDDGNANEGEPGPDDIVTLSLIGPSSVVEGEDTASYTVTLSEAIPSVEEGGSDVVVTLSYSYTTASGDDITETADVTIAAGSASGTFTISTIDDALAEGAENFQVSITNGGIADSNFENVEVSSTSNSVTTTIDDGNANEGEPGPDDIVTLSLIGPSSVVEGEDTASYTVTLSEAIPSVEEVARMWL
jgi:hypothetical protein